MRRASGNVALGLASELACAGERAEEVGAAVVHQSAGGSVGVYCHPTNGIHRELALSRLSLAERGEKLDGFANVPQGFAAARLVEHVVELGYERSGVRRQ
jgi:hypothetical protein